MPGFCDIFAKDIPIAFGSARFLCIHEFQLVLECPGGKI